MLIARQPLGPPKGNPRDHLRVILGYSCRGLRREWALIGQQDHRMPTPSVFLPLRSHGAESPPPSHGRDPSPLTERSSCPVGGDRGRRVGCPPRPFSDSWDSIRSRAATWGSSRGSAILYGQKKGLSEEIRSASRNGLAGPTRPAARASFGPATVPMLPRAEQRCPLR